MKITIETEDGQIKRLIRIRFPSDGWESEVGVDQLQEYLEELDFIEGDFLRCHFCEVISNDAEITECEDGALRCPKCRGKSASHPEQ